MNVGVDVSVADLAGRSKEEFWEMVKDLAFDMMGRLIYAVVDYELEGFIGAGWHERNAPGRKTTRAGRRKRGFTILGRDLELWIPRARIGGFQSQFIEKRERREKAFDEAVVNAYVAGPSMRETTALFYEIFGTSVSPGTISQLVKGLDAEREVFQSRQLKDEYTYVILDGMHVRCMVAPAATVGGAKNGETVEKVAVLLARGIKEDGTRELIDFRLAPGEIEVAWEAFLRDLFDRGLEFANTRLIVHDGSQGIENGIESVLGAEVLAQRCICHKLANVSDAVEDKQRREKVREEASRVYHAESAEEAKKRLAAFSRKWKRLEPRAVEIFRRGFEATLAFFTVPREHRKWITTTNPLERYIREVRRRTRPMGVFQGVASCERLIYVAIWKLSNERRNRIPYSLWTSQPGYGTRRRRRPRESKPDMAALRKELYLTLNRWITLD